MQTSGEMADYFEGAGKEKRSVQLNIRVSRRMKKQLDLLALYWTRRARTVNPDAVTRTIGDVVIRLLEVGLQGAWTDAGLSKEPTQEEVEALIDSLKPN